MNWLDWLIIAVLALSAFQGMRHGLVAGVAKLAGVLIGLWVAVNYYRPFAQYLSGQWNMEEKILPLVDGVLRFWLPSKDAVPPNLPPGTPVANQLNPLGDYFGRMFSSLVLDALSFLILLLITVWAVNLVGRILSRIADFALMGPLNHLGGLFFGAARGLLLVVVILTLLSPFQRSGLLPGSRSGTPGAVSPQGTSFQDSRLLPYFEPLLNALNRSLPAIPSVGKELGEPVKSI